MIRALAFTEHGMQTGERIKAFMPDMQLTRCEKGGLAAWTAQSFEEADVIIYIGAAGIAVRAIAPHVVSKLHDPAVLVIDELGRYVIPILSGHVGGANAAAVRIASCLDAQAIVTTATDLNNKFAVDVWAVKNGLAILNKDGIKEVSSRVLKGENVNVYSQWPIEDDIPEGLSMTDDLKTAHVIIACRGAARDTAKTDTGRGAPVDESKRADRAYSALRLAPRCLYVGIGCRRDIPQEAIEAAWAHVAQEYGLVEAAVAGITSIDIKAHEPGLVAFCRAHGLELTTYSEAELNAVPGEFHGSAFVKKTVGVDSVCERSAMLAARTARAQLAAQAADFESTGCSSSDITGEARIIVPKTAENGVTVAVALANPRMSWHT